MARAKLFGGEIEGEYPLRRWVELFNAGEFSATKNPFDAMSRAIDAGAFDWWDDRKAISWVDRLGDKVCMLACGSPKVNMDTMYVFYKQICPCCGPLYDSFRICDIKSGRVLFCIDHLKKGCYDEQFSGWEVHQYTNDEDNREIAEVKGTWRDVKKWFEI